MKKVRITETVHVWEGKAIIRNAEGKLDEVLLGTVQTDKKYKEVGAKELFTKLPEGTITVEVTKLTDVSISYEAELEEFKKIAKVVETAESNSEEQEQAEGDK
jgi:hypothetical protein